ncbi:hypothetical protein [Thiohalobacter thiocyanaticus]|uniref:Uncharacterized protein n=1 Tax=Thiohalobacter thiocyanaticus TaxID=585455 RepID=A0A426QIB8_9GAMM|nr:hypothetical protein [Thiohalobacter thiocyanaticus]RRQ21493.1 hypothetical protein D6C00_05765 [Thiohalobacter thiocyanaticus]
MRFHQLRIGDRFRLEGEIYTKHNALLAVHAASGRQQLIKRSAAVEPCPSETTAAAPAHREVPAAVVLEAFDAFYDQCRQLLAGCGNDGQLNARLEQARRVFLDQLQNSSS